MFISVDLPAPFSPSNACTSPRRTSRSTSSLATVPGNSFRTPRISRTRSSAIAEHPKRNAKGRARGPPFRIHAASECLEAARHLERAGDDPRLVRGDELDPGPRNRRADPADAHATVLQVEQQV